MTAPDPHPARTMSPLDHLLDVFRLKQYFHVLVRTRDLVEGVASDVTFLTAVANAVAPLPAGPRRHRSSPFPKAVPFDPNLPSGHRVGLLASGGGGALASVVGVARALEEGGVRPAVISVCSGAALFGFPIAAGLSPDEVAEFVLNVHPRRLVDVDWWGFARLGLAAGRGFTGLMHGDAVEETYRARFGDLRLRDLTIPCYAPIWNVERNTVEYLGPRTFPDVTLARAVRMAVCLPLFYEPVRLDGCHWSDGGIVDILPVPPLLDVEEKCDAAVVVNGFYPEGLASEDVQGWERQTLSILRLASQVRTCQHLDLARKSLERLTREVDVTVVEPVSYAETRGVGLYRQYIDSAKWPDYMRAGRAATRAALLRARTARAPAAAAGA